MKFSRQPLVWLHVLALAIGLGLTFGLKLTVDQTAAIMGLAQAAAAAIGWTQVTPTADLPAAPVDPAPLDVAAVMAAAVADYQRSLATVQAIAAAVTPPPVAAPVAPVVVPEGPVQVTSP